MTKDTALWMNKSQLKPTKGDSVEYRENMRKLQKIYALEEKME